MPVPLRLMIAPARSGRAVGRLLALLAALLLVAAVQGGSASPNEPPTNDVAQHDGFRFSPGTCEQGPQFCALSTPRAWAPAEIALVRAALDEIAASDLGRWITQRARRNGFITLRRFGYAAELDAGGQFGVQPMIVATTHTDARHDIRSIDLMDRFFEREAVRDHFSGEPGYLLTTEILAHELMHAVDLRQQYSATVDFGRVAGLGMSVTRQQDADRVNLERERLNSEGRYEAAWQASRSFGIVSMRGRLPSVQALDSYREAFAEFGAHLVLDPNARRRFDPRLLLFFARTASATP
jgi:hypothetical protein